MRLLGATPKLGDRSDSQCIMSETDPHDVHPLYIRQEAQKVGRFFAHLYVDRGLAFFGIVAAITFWATDHSQQAGWILLASGAFLAAAAYDKLLYDRSYRSFEKRFEVSPRDYLANHPQD